MPVPLPLPVEKIIAAKELFDQGMTQAQVAASIGVPPRTVSDWIRGVRRSAVRGVVGGPPIPESAKPPEGFAISRNAGAYDADGKLLRQWVGTKRDAGEVYEAPAGHVVKGESALVDADGRVMQRWVKTTQGGGDGLVEGLRAAFAAYEGRAGVIAAPEISNDDILTVYPIPDLHFGMYSWRAETGADYDTQIATRIAESGIADLVAQSMPSETAVVLVLGDYFHQNDQKNATPGSGHRLDVDGRWAKVYRDGAMLLLEIVRLVATKHKRVIIKILPGNHDEDAAVTLTVAISLFFSRDDRIAVDMSPQNTWYHRFGNVLLGAHHGHQIRKFGMMAAAMAVDRPQDWGQTEFRYFYSGHIHHKTSEESMGVEVESFASPAAPDAYNSGSGYRSGRSFTAITHHRERGEIGRHRVAIRQREAA